MEKQTAVKWLEFEIYKRGPKEDNPPQWLKELYDQAKEMEKQQIMDSWKNGDGWNGEYFAEEYYNETFGKL
jgi:hypothetical protein